MLLGRNKDESRDRDGNTNGKRHREKEIERDSVGIPLIFCSSMCLLTISCGSRII